MNFHLISWSSFHVPKLPWATDQALQSDHGSINGEPPFNQRRQWGLLKDQSRYWTTSPDKLTLTEILVNRSCIWQKACVWYKVALVDSSRLKNLMIEFSGEAGLDAGALRNEFLTTVLQEMNVHFFRRARIQAHSKKTSGILRKRLRWPEWWWLTLYCWVHHLSLVYIRLCTSGW